MNAFGHKLEGLHCLIYVRVSSQKQADEGHGLDGQEQACREYADRHGMEVIKVFREEGVSGGDFNRPALQAMFAFIESHGDIGMVLFEDVNRIARGIDVHVQVLAHLKKLNVKFQTVNQPIEDTHIGKFIVNSLASIAEFQKDQNRENVVNKMRARMLAGYWCVGGPMTGYKTANQIGHGKVLVRDEPQASLVAEALDGFGRGRFTDQVDVRRFLEAKAFNGAGKSVHPQLIRRLLERSEFYAGYLEYPKWEVSRREGQHPALITLEAAQRIQERLHGKVRRLQRKDHNPEFPLRGKVTCSACSKFLTGSRATGRNKKHYFHYWCKTAGCERRYKTIRKAEIEKQFENILKQAKLSEDLAGLLKDEVMAIWQKRIEDRGYARKQIDTELAKNNADVEEYIELAVKTHSSKVRAAYERKVDALERRNEALSQQASQRDQQTPEFGTALNLAFSFAKNPYATWKSERLEDKQMVLKLIFPKPLTYDFESGFGTTELSLIYEVSSAYETSQSHLVTPRGIEPRFPG